jgi:hypothetical protein
MIRIDTDIPLPKSKRLPKVRHKKKEFIERIPIEKLEPGHSFWFDVYSESLRQRVWRAAYTWAEENNLVAESQFKSRRIGKGLRFWRLK